MRDYCQKLNFRGQKVLRQGNRLSITITDSQPQPGGPPTVGLSDNLLKYANKYKLTIFVSVVNPPVQFITTAKEWYKTSKKEPHYFYYPEPFYIYRGNIPEKAFKKNEPVVSPDPSLLPCEESDRQEFYRLVSPYAW